MLGFKQLIKIILNLVLPRFVCFATLAALPRFAAAAASTSHTSSVRHDIIVRSYTIGQSAVARGTGVEVKTGCLRIVDGQLGARRFVAAIRIRIPSAVGTTGLEAWRTSIWSSGVSYAVRTRIHW